MITHETGTLTTLGGITLDKPVVSPRGDLYEVARVLLQHFDHSCTEGERVQFDLSVDEAYNVEAYHVRRAEELLKENYDGYTKDGNPDSIRPTRAAGHILSTETWWTRGCL